ncbi:MAG: hypothetical protein AB1589_25760, partial [Cyanobacteriota bacterium]
MANFLTRLVTRHLGLTPVVQPFIAPMFTSEAVVLSSDSLGFEAQTSSIDSFWEEERSWGAGELGSRGAGELGSRGAGELGSWGAGELGRAEFKADSSSTGTGKMPIPQAELSSSGEVGVSPAQAMGTSSEIHTSRSQNVQEMRSHLAHPSPLTEPSSSQTPKADTPQNQGNNFIATPPTQPPAAPGMIQRQVDASMRSHSSIDSPVNPPNLAESGGFVVEDILLEQPTLPLVPPQAIPSVQPTTTNAPSRVEPLINQVLETGQQRDNTEVLERDRSNAQPDSQISNLGQRNAPRETQEIPPVQPSPASEMIQPLRSAESPMSPPIQAPQSQASHRPNSVQDVSNTIPSSKHSATPPVQNQGNAANVNSPELPLVRSETVLPIQPSVESKPSRVEPLINNDVASSVQPTQQSIESNLNPYHINTEKSINRRQNTSTARSSEQMRGRIEADMGRSLPEDSSSQPVPTVPSRTFSQQLETSTGSNPPLGTPAPRREFIQLVPPRSMIASQSVPVSGVPDGEMRRRGDGGKESVGSLTATGDERMSEQPYLPHQNVDDPPKSPIKSGTVS